MRDLRKKKRIRKKGANSREPFPQTDPILWFFLTTHARAHDPQERLDGRWSYRTVEWTRRTLGSIFAGLPSC